MDCRKKLLKCFKAHFKDLQEMAELLVGREQSVILFLVFKESLIADTKSQLGFEEHHSSRQGLITFYFEQSGFPIINQLCQRNDSNLVLKYYYESFVVGKSDGLHFSKRELIGQRELNFGY